MSLRLSSKAWGCPRTIVYRSVSLSVRRERESRHLNQRRTVRYAGLLSQLFQSAHGFVCNRSRHNCPCGHCCCGLGCLSRGLGFGHAVRKSRHQPFSRVRRQVDIRSCRRCTSSVEHLRSRPLGLCMNLESNLPFFQLCFPER